MTPQEVLLKAADLIEQPGVWIQGEMAMTRDGRSVSANSSDAVCFCALGAIRHFKGHEGNITQERKLMRRVIYGYDSDEFSMIDDWNDRPGRTAQEVAEAMRKAAAL